MSSSDYVKRVDRLVVDANILIGAVLGGEDGATRTLIARLLASGIALFAPEELATELDEHLPRLIQRQLAARFPTFRQDEALTAAHAIWQDMLEAVNVIPAGDYHSLAAHARRRVPADPDDWPYVALALRLDCGILTKNLAHFGASGIPIWSLETVRLLVEE